jgi:ketol-acid reductoisomerase
MPNEPAHPSSDGPHGPQAPAPPFPLRVAFLGYGDAAREQALRLKALPSHWRVDVVVRPGGMSWIRAVADGFRPVPPSEAAARADVVAVHLPEREQPGVWAYSVEPYLAPGALVVFARGSALYAGSVDPGSDLDVALVRKTAGGPGAGPENTPCRVAVHRDATGRALERSAAFARAVFGATSVGTTTLDAEVRADITALVETMGGLPALLAEWDRLLADPGHEPDQAILGYYERLRAAFTAGVTSGRDARRSGADGAEPQGTAASKRAPRWKVDLSKTVVSKKRGAA